MAKPQRQYIIPVILHSLDVLDLIQRESQPMTLEEIYQRTSVPKSTAFRILRTLVHRGYVFRASDKTYRYSTGPKKPCIGVISQRADRSRSNQLTESLKRAAIHVGVDLILLDGHEGRTELIRDVEWLVTCRVGALIASQVDLQYTHVVGKRAAAARTPGSSRGSRSHREWRSRVSYPLRHDRKDGRPER